MRLREKAPDTCPRCGHDPTGDDDEFRSGGGWEHDHSIDGARWTERFRCPVCSKTVAKIEEKETLTDGGEPDLDEEDVEQIEEFVDAVRAMIEQEGRGR